MNACSEKVPYSTDRLDRKVLPAAVSVPEPIRVWLVDDDPRVRDLLAALLSQSPGIDCSRIFPSAAAVLSALSSEPAPDVSLVDLRLGTEDGVSTLTRLRTLAPRADAFVISTFYDSLEEARARKAGALGFFVKHSVERILEGLRTAGRRRPVAAFGS